MKKEKVNKNLEKIRHSLSHLMAQVIQEKFPGVKFGIGPVIENGFYYDFEFPQGKEISQEDLPLIEKRMKELIKAGLRFQKEKISFPLAKKIFKNQPYKLELIQELKKAKKPLTIYRTLDQNKKEVFVDLCAGPHVKTTKEINPEAFCLTKIAGAYWRGDEKNPMLKRIYGLAFETKKELADYLYFLEEAQKRDHRKLGQELDLFSFHEEMGPGLVYWHPKGGRIRVVMEDFWRKVHFKNGYEIIYTPHIGKADLWKISGHLDFYRENMYAPMKIDEEEYFLKPMNCPFHIQIYKTRVRSYRDLPLRWAELGTVYRYEKAGVLHGLLRVRGFTQDDAHIICTPEQMPEEIQKVLNLSLFILKSFGFQKFNVYLSTKPPKAVGSEKMWKEATRALEKAIKNAKLSYQIDPGGGVFYGPKIDIKIEDSLKREWQCSTIQFDFNLPERFQMSYIGKDGRPHQPYMIHRALMGSLERFFGTLIEHYAGAFPFWLAPVQIQILPVNENYLPEAKKLKNLLENYDFRVNIDASNETINKRVREAELQKIPYIVVIGEKEKKTGKLAIRERGKKEISFLEIEEFIHHCQKLLPKI